MHLKCNNKVVSVCGDFNVNLLNADTHKDTYNFSEMMCAHGLFPLIDKPTRIDIHSSTLIDNIFANNISCNCNSGILMNDISDHMPIFTCCEQKLFENRTEQFKFVRKSKNENICNLKEQLLDTNWNELYRCGDVNEADNKFISELTLAYNNCCPVKKNQD